MDGWMDGRPKSNAHFPLPVSLPPSLPRLVSCTFWQWGEEVISRIPDLWWSAFRQSRQDIGDRHTCGRVGFMHELANKIGALAFNDEVECKSGSSILTPACLGTVSDKKTIQYALPACVH